MKINRGQHTLGRKCQLWTGVWHRLRIKSYELIVVVGLADFFTYSLLRGAPRRRRPPMYVVCIPRRIKRTRIMSSAGNKRAGAG